MGAKKINNFEMLFSGSVNGVMSGTNTIVSNIQNIQNFDNSAIQFVWTGTATGTITVSVSVNGTVFDPLTFDTPIVQPAGASGHWTVNLNQLPMPYVQVGYTNASGSGVLNAFIFSKDLN